jgi:vacuolar-type H+-ATPase subunit F/Vma7
METTSGPVAAIGEEALLAGYRLAGVQVLPAGTAAQARRCWASLPAGTSLVLLTRTAATAIDDLRDQPRAPLTAVLPDEGAGGMKGLAG